MGGTSKVQIAKYSDRRVKRNNELLWSGIVVAAKTHFDDLPFGAREVMIHAGKNESSPMLTRDRGGLKRFMSDYWKEFIRELRIIVKGYKEDPAGRVFCRELGFLLVSYHGFFELDVTTLGYRYAKATLELIEPLIDERHLLIFCAEFYQLIALWCDDGFTRGSVIEKYGDELYRLFTKYQLEQIKLGGEN